MPLAVAHTVSRASLVLFLVILWLDFSIADTFTGDNAFFWGFNDTSITAALTQCKRLTTIVTANATNGPLGTPPYYMVAFNPGGIPTTSFIGTNPGNLTWQVNQPSGPVLVLGVVDANGFSGGIKSNTFTVTGDDSSCLPSPSSTDLKIISNVSTSELLQTCQPLGFQVTGGTKPYTISIAALDSTLVTNVTMGSDHDLLTYINRVSPGDQLVVSVSDANGWGTSTGLFSTTGTTDLTCNNIITTSGNSVSSSSSDGTSSATSQAPGSPSSNAVRYNSSSNSHTRIIAGAAAGGGIAVAVLTVALCMRYRRRYVNQSKQTDLVPSPFMSSAATGLGVSASTTNVAESVNVPDSGVKRTNDNSNAGVSAPCQINPMHVPESGSRFIQHQDGNDVVELPPPYIDRSSSRQLELGGGTDPRTSLVEMNVVDSSAGTAPSSLGGPN